MEQAMQGSREAFTVLVDRAHARLVGTAGLILRDRGWAEDAAQDALLRAWRDLPSLRDADGTERIPPPWSSSPFADDRSGPGCPASGHRAALRERRARQARRMPASSDRLPIRMQVQFPGRPVRHSG